MVKTQEDHKVTVERAFDKAIEEGRLSIDPEAGNYAGKYMYMGYYGGKDNFKSILSREYDV